MVSAHTLPDSDNQRRETWPFGRDCEVAVAGVMNMMNMPAALKKDYSMTPAREFGAAVWPIMVDLDGDAYTLWGPAGGQRDLLLTVGGELLAFRRWSDLVAFVLQDRPSNFSRISGYRSLQDTLAQPVRS